MPTSKTPAQRTREWREARKASPLCYQCQKYPKSIDSKTGEVLRLCIACIAQREERRADPKRKLRIKKKLSAAQKKRFAKIPEAAKKAFSKTGVAARKARKPTSKPLPKRLDLSAAGLRQSVKSLVSLGWSYRQISSALKGRKIHISKSTIATIAKS